MPKKKTKKKVKKSASKKRKVTRKKKTVRKSKSKIKKSKKKVSSKPLKPKIEGEYVGKVTHYFPHVNAAVLIVKKKGLKIGDQILIKGHTTDFKEQITSMQIDRTPISEAKKGDEIGLFVKERVRAHDEVYKINR